MIRHDNVFIHFKARKTLGETKIFTLSNQPETVQIHLFLQDFPKQLLVIPRSKSKIIGAWVRVIVFRKAD